MEEHKNIKFGLWVNVQPKGKRKLLDFSDISITVDVSKQIGAALIALRVLTLPFDKVPTSDLQDHLNYRHNILLGMYVCVYISICVGLSMLIITLFLGFFCLFECQSPSLFCCLYLCIDRSIDPSIVSTINHLQGAAYPSISSTCPPTQSG